MTRYTRYMAILVLMMFCMAVLPACKTKEGCPVNDSAHVKPNKKGDYGSKKGKTNLFPKDLRKE
ncbi:MAG: hypothetical protein KA974_04075 [Saprospiraceae bacterium]|nr:hypothetical protein [Saprospiraceae bacterium]MBP7699879.1 hypothetical protein [Saprospiraceae bacterium]